MTLLVFIVRTDLSVEAPVRMMVAGPSYIGSFKRWEERQAVKLRHVAGHWLVIVPVFLASKALFVAERVGMMIVGLSFIGSSELVNLLPRLFLGMLLSSVGTASVSSVTFGCTGAETSPSERREVLWGVKLRHAAGYRLFRAAAEGLR